MCSEPAYEKSKGTNVRAGEQNKETITIPIMIKIKISLFLFFFFIIISACNGHFYPLKWILSIIYMNDIYVYD